LSHDHFFECSMLCGAWWSMTRRHGDYSPYLVWPSSGMMKCAGA
jgi:hypothetical protein